MKKYSKIFGKDTIAVLEPINSDNLELICVTTENLVDSLLGLIPDVFLPPQVTFKDIVNKVCDDMIEHSPTNEGLKIKHRINVKTLAGVDTYHSLDEFLKVDAVKHNKCHLMLLGDGTETVCLEIESRRYVIAEVIYGSLKESFLYDSLMGLEVFEIVEMVKPVNKPTTLMIEAMGLL